MKNLHLAYACKALDQLAQQPMSLRNSYKIMKLQQKVSPLYTLYSKGEAKIIEDLGLVNSMDGYNIKFEDDETAAKYAELHRELDEMDAEFDPAWRIRLDPEERLRISPRDMMLLSEMVDFGLEEKEPADE